FFFQAEDGIRDPLVTGVQTCALPISRFPSIVGPRKEDICYATTNRQKAVKGLLGQVDVVLVVGSRESSNSNRLVETARAAGVARSEERRVGKAGGGQWRGRAEGRDNG